MRVYARALDDAVGRAFVDAGEEDEAVVAQRDVALWRGVQDMQ